MQLPSWVWLWVKCQHYILSHGNLLGLSGTSPCRSHEVFLSSLGCWKQPWFSLSFFNNANREHGLHSGCQHYSLCPMLKFFLLAILYCCTANHRNFKLQEFLTVYSHYSLLLQWLRSAVLHYKSFPVLKPADSLIHTESYPVVPIGFRLYVLLCLWVNFLSILYKETKDCCTWTWPGCMLTLPACIQVLSPRKTGSFECVKNSACQFFYQKNVLSCPLSPSPVPSPPPVFMVF